MSILAVFPIRGIFRSTSLRKRRSSFWKLLELSSFWKLLGSSIRVMFLQLSPYSNRIVMTDLHCFSVKSVPSSSKFCNELRHAFSSRSCSNQPKRLFMLGSDTC
ncbi:hypothetical protein CDAR_295911 [Caerostris darwini]|uniref:Uncharacterized protein n=1 Tax=Caerostris darwini TaxID=1538125 RepID=A0AAV4SXY8_9ARAC|nr:hypothetical protein CDAR_295911 [Caerostris darwini]